MVTGDEDSDHILASSDRPAVDVPLPPDPAPTGKSPAAPPSLSFLNDPEEGDKPAILKLLDTAQLPSSSFLMSSMKVGSYHNSWFSFMLFFISSRGNRELVVRKLIIRMWVEPDSPPDGCLFLQ